MDFGNAIHCVHEELSLYYGDFELQTLLYRAPEVMFHGLDRLPAISLVYASQVMFGTEFGLEVDLWSLGCILAELFSGIPLFYGKDKASILTKVSIPLAVCCGDHRRLPHALPLSRPWSYWAPCLKGFASGESSSRSCGNSRQRILRPMVSFFAGNLKLSPHGMNSIFAVDLFFSYFLHHESFKVQRLVVCQLPRWTSVL